jgi:hypothetical protein
LQNDLNKFFNDKTILNELFALPQNDLEFSISKIEHMSLNKEHSFLLIITLTFLSNLNHFMIPKLEGSMLIVVGLLLALTSTSLLNPNQVQIKEEGLPTNSP